MLSINTYTTYSCSKKKEPPFGSFLSVCAFTAAFSMLLFLVYIKMPIQMSFNGKGFFALIGFLYVIPLKFFFDQSIKNMIIIMSSSWIYTVFAFSFSVQVGYLFPSDWFIISVVITQTLFNAATLPYYIKFVKEKFIYILRNIDNRMINSLLVISLSWFFIIFLLNFSFAEGNSSLLRFILLIIIIGNAILSYRMVFNLVSINNKAEELTHITKIDMLTQLKNREGLYEDVLQKIDINMPFTLIFIDLDDFKSINDCFGHASGDAYLIEFVKAVTELLNTNDSFYRLHGDEFIILTDVSGVEIICRKIKKLVFSNVSNDVAFKGLSLGYSSFPEDGEKLNDLLFLADMRMYQAKRKSRDF
jgi:diguanylate cyclase (GGDEF)-like protein